MEYDFLSVNDMQEWIFLLQKPIPALFSRQQIYISAVFLFPGGNIQKDFCLAVAYIQMQRERQIICIVCRK